MEYQIKQIKGYEGIYEVSNTGEVFSLKFGKRKKLKVDYVGGGYANVILTKDGKRKNHRVHRLVAEAFIDNPNNLPCINHKDENKTNNLVDNLEFCTAKYNLEYSDVFSKAHEAAYNARWWEYGNEARRTVVCQYTKKGEFVAEYPSLIEAERQTGIPQSNICFNCMGKRKSAGGYRWEYKKEGI